LPSEVLLPNVGQPRVRFPADARNSSFELCLLLFLSGLPSGCGGKLCQTSVGGLETLSWEHGALDVNVGKRMDVPLFCECSGGGGRRRWLSRLIDVQLGV
jgi:hypothetical protein